MKNAENIGSPAAKAVQKKASGSSFYLAMRLMPAEERDAMFAIYAFCRKVDDIADDGIGTRVQRHEKLEQWRSDLWELYAGHAPAQVRFLAPAVAQYGLRLDDFLSVLDGMAMDVAEDIVAPD
jgi:phytoene/squalene synthetase